MAIKECTNCPGAIDHDTANCPMVRAPRELLERVLEGLDKGFPLLKVAEELRALLSEHPQASAEEERARKDDAAFNLRQLFLRGAKALNLEPDETSWFEIVGELEKLATSAAQSAPKPQRKTWRTGNPSYLCYHCNTPLMMHAQQIYCPEGPAFASNSTAAQSAPAGEREEPGK